MEEDLLDHFQFLEKAILFPEHMINCGYQAYSGGKLFHGIDKDNTVFGLHHLLMKWMVGILDQ